MIGPYVREDGGFVTEAEQKCMLLSGKPQNRYLLLPFLASIADQSLLFCRHFTMAYRYVLFQTVPFGEFSIAFVALKLLVVLRHMLQFHVIGQGEFVAKRFVAC